MQCIFKYFCQFLAIGKQQSVFKKIAVFWVVALCSLVEVYQSLKGACCLHHQGDE
jgi:hypothetical protein